MPRIRVIAALAAASLLIARFVASDHAADADEALDRTLCRLIENSAQANGLPVPFLTRLIFRESTFRVDAVSRSGAQGVAQFMPATAAALGLADPFDPEQAVPQAARHLSDLRKHFGNLGLAAAAYNGGPTRVATWLAGKGDLKPESRTYVTFVTGRELEDWRGEPTASTLPAVADGVTLASFTETEAPCLRQIADLRTTAPVTRVAFAGSRPIAASSVIRVANPMARPSQPRRVALAQAEPRTPMARPALRRVVLAQALGVRAPTRPKNAARPTTRLALEQITAMPWQSLARRGPDALRMMEPRRTRLSRSREVMRPRFVRLASAGLRKRFAASQPGRRGFLRRRSRV